jgi:DME family drug/metabolite transporter
MPLIGEIFSLLSAVVWASAIILFRIAGAKVEAIELNLVKSSIAMGLLLVTWLAFFLHDPLAHGVNFTTVEYIILIATGLVSITLADTLLLKSLQYIGAARNAVLACLFSPFVIGLSILFLGQSLNWMQIGGFSLVVFSTFLITTQKSNMTISKEDLRKGSILGILSVFFIAVGMTAVKPIVEDESVLATAAIRMTAAVLGNITWILITGRIAKSITIIKTSIPWKTVFIAAFLGSYTALLCWIIGFKNTDTSSASVLNQTSVLFTLVFAAIFLNERMGIQKIGGALIGFAGVAIIFLIQ